MKHTSVLIFFTFLLTNQLFSQAEKPDTSDIHATILDTRRNIAQYKKVEKVHTPTDEKFVYKDGEEIKLITIRTTDKGIEKNVAWFYSKGQLIYTEQYWLDPVTAKITDNEKFYLHKGQLIAWVNTENKLVDNSSSEFRTLESSLNKFGPKWRDDLAK